MMNKIIRPGQTKPVEINKGVEMERVLQTIDPFRDSLKRYMRDGYATVDGNISKGYGVLKGVLSEFQPAVSSDGKKGYIKSGVMFVYGRCVVNTEDQEIFFDSESMAKSITCHLIVNLSETMNQSASFLVTKNIGENNFHEEDEGDNLAIRQNGIAKVLIGKWAYKNGIATLVPVATPKIVPNIYDSVRNLKGDDCINHVKISSMMNGDHFKHAKHAAVAKRLNNVITEHSSLYTYGAMRKMFNVSALNGKGYINKRGDTYTGYNFYLSEPIDMKNIIGFRFVLMQTTLAQAGYTYFMRFAAKPYARDMIYHNRPMFTGDFHGFEKTVFVPKEYRDKDIATLNYQTFVVSQYNYPYGDVSEGEKNHVYNPTIGRRDLQFFSNCPGLTSVINWFTPMNGSFGSGFYAGTLTSNPDTSTNFHYFNEICKPLNELSLKISGNKLYGGIITNISYYFTTGYEGNFPAWLFPEAVNYKQDKNTHKNEPIGDDSFAFYIQPIYEVK